MHQRRVCANEPQLSQPPCAAPENYPGKRLPAGNSSPIGKKSLYCARQPVFGRGWSLVTDGNYRRASSERSSSRRRSVAAMLLRAWINPDLRAA